MGGGSESVSVLTLVVFDALSLPFPAAWPNREHARCTELNQSIANRDRRRVWARDGEILVGGVRLWEWCNARERVKRVSMYMCVREP